MAKKKGKKGGKAKVEKTMTWNEALLAYKINIKQVSLDEIKTELKALETKNERHKERLTRLNEEQESYVAHLLVEAHKLNKNLSEEAVIPKSDVTEAMKGNWMAVTEAEMDLEKVINALREKEQEISDTEKQVEMWQNYRDKDDDQQKKQVLLLEQEIQDMLRTFDEMKAHLQGSWNNTRNKIINDTDMSVDQQKYIASQRAMTHMDKFSRQEVIDNEWLKREEYIHSREVNLLQADVEELERENLAMMSDLFECNVEDLKISRNFFLTQFSDEAENLEKEGILEMDLRTIIPDDTMKPLRPKSAIQKAVEHKVFSLPIQAYDCGSDNEEDIHIPEIDVECEDANEMHSEFDILSAKFNFDDVIFDDYLKLGPLELKLLSVRGEKVKLYEEEVANKIEKKAELTNPKVWPVTSKMLNCAINPSNRISFTT